MTQAITLPLWVFIVLLALALLAVLEWLLLPGLRWYFRRKVRHVLDEIGVRLKIDIPLQAHAPPGADRPPDE